LNSSGGSWNVALEMSLKCRNVYMLWNMSKAMTKPKMGMATLEICEKFSFRLNFCTMYVCTGV